jgi:hypothetical protein
VASIPYFDFCSVSFQHRSSCHTKPTGRRPLFLQHRSIYGNRTKPSNNVRIEQHRSAYSTSTVLAKACRHHLPSTVAQALISSCEAKTAIVRQACSRVSGGRGVLPFHAASHRGHSRDYEGAAGRRCDLIVDGAALYTRHMFHAVCSPVSNKHLHRHAAPSMNSLSPHPSGNPKPGSTSRSPAL